MTPQQEYWWRVALELKMRQSSGESFQTFFGDLMQAVYGDDFVRIRPFGSLGDKGCDGYLKSSGAVYQCYGAVNGDGGKVSYLIGKMGTDYATAAAKLPGIMKGWRMVHNLVDGLPIEAVDKLAEIEGKNPQLKCEFVGMESIATMMLSLGAARIEEFLGPAATNADAQNFQTQDLRDLVDAIVKSLDAVSVSSEPIKTVSPLKLIFNKLPKHWCSLISSGWQNAHHVSGYFGRHPDPLTGERIAQAFRHRYAYLRSQSLLPSAIMSELYIMVTGKGHVTAERQVAAQALLAHLFESCDIFEDVPDGAMAG